MRVRKVKNIADFHLWSSSYYIYLLCGIGSFSDHGLPIAWVSRLLTCYGRKLSAPTANLHPASICTTYINIKQDRQCKYNVTWRRVHTTIVAVEKQ